MGGDRPLEEREARQAGWKVLGVLLTGTDDLRDGRAHAHGSAVREILYCTSVLHMYLN